MMLRRSLLALSAAVTEAGGDAGAAAGPVACAFARAYERTLTQQRGYLGAVQLGLCTEGDALSADALRAWRGAVRAVRELADEGMHSALSLEVQWTALAAPCMLCEHPEGAALLAAAADAEAATARAGWQEPFRGSFSR